MVERDVAGAADFGDHLAGRPESRSLRDFREGDVVDYLASVRADATTEAQAKEARTAMTRLVRFLRDTGRMDWPEARDLLGTLRNSLRA